ncbi:hypothetical protein Scep_021677 [Stephania cephalantha]|uniref:Uncharacterized protein n=1 Tax=Stephania cephalantha TaxID=152367 RepID=A0AAP0HX19_9MAGN
MTKIFKRWMITEGYCWKSLPDHQNDIYILGVMETYFQWDPLIDEVIVRAAYDAKTCVRYGALMHELRAHGVRPDFVTDEVWNRYCEYWASTDFKALEKDEEDEVTPNDVFLHVHTKDNDGVTFIDSRSARFHVSVLANGAREEHTQTTPDQLIDEKQLYYDAAGECPKGRVCGLGSLAKMKKRYEDPGASTSPEPMVGVQSLMQLFRGLRNSRLSCRASWECAWTSERAPLRHHHRHHLISIICRLGWIRLVHRRSSTTMMMGTSRIGWMKNTW